MRSRVYVNVVGVSGTAGVVAFVIWIVEQFEIWTGGTRDVVLEVGVAVARPGDHVARDDGACTSASPAGRPPR